MEALGFPIRQEASLNILTTDVVTSSAIEGERLDTDEVRSSIARRLGIPQQNDKPVGHDVEGIVEMMLDATQNFDQALTAERLFDWHAALFPTGRSGMHRITVGAWRPAEAGPMQVVSGPTGRETVHYEAPEASGLDAEMTKLLSWFENDLNLDPVLKAGIAHLWFVTIHPFEDGNGRIARAIADMALARADGTSSRFYSMSRQIEQERKAYYTQLERQQKGSVDITSWLSWFLNCFSRAVFNAEDTLSSVLFKAELWNRINPDPVNERQRLIINRMLDNFKGHMTTSKYARTRRSPHSDSKSGWGTKYKLPPDHGKRTGASWCWGDKKVIESSRDRPWFRACRRYFLDIILRITSSNIKSLPMPPSLTLLLCMESRLPQNLAIKKGLLGLLKAKYS
jgi:Fic family protein